MRYIYKILIILIIIYTGIFSALADEPEWIDSQEKTLRLTESFVRDGFIIEASDFFENSALITVYDTDHRLLTRNITRINDYFKINDQMNITIVDLQERTGNISGGHGVNVVVDQWVKIQTRIAGRPVPKLSIVPLERHINNKTIISRVFVPGSEISINVSIRNDGKAVLKNLTLRINSTLPLLSGEKLDYELPNLNAGNESDIIQVRFKAPFTEERKAFTILAEAKGNDIFGRSYQANDSTYIEVTPQIDKRIELKKFVSEKVYMGDIAVVTVSIKNNFSQSIDNVSLTESLPAGIEPVDTNLSWNFTIGPDEQKSISYKIKPQQPGTYFFLPGSSIIEYQGLVGYNTKLAKLIVNGPYVVLVKSVNIANPAKGQGMIIMIEAKNTGDATAIVKLNDTVPANYSLSNDLSEKELYNMLTNTSVIRPGGSASISYIINATSPGIFTLPAAKAVVLDQFLYRDERYTQRISSNSLIIKVGESITMQPPPVRMISTPKQTTVPESTEVPVSTPKPVAGFQGYILIMLIIIIWTTIKQNFKKKIDKSKKNILIFSSIMVFFVLVITSANAYQRPEFTDGLTDRWHPGGYCIPCHYTLIGTEKAQAISTGCTCHEIAPKKVENGGGYKINMTKVLDVHKDIVCIRCHIGMKNEANVTAVDFHRVMSKTACLDCHTFENGTYLKPQKTKCSDCHGGDPHVVHGKRLDKMCVACHGEFADKYVSKMGPPSALNVSVTVTKEYPTIGEFMTRIIESLMHMLR